MSRNLWNTKLFTNNEHTLAFPDSRATVLLRDDVSNRNMLKNPYNTKNEVPPVRGLRPPMITADNLGNVFARSKVGLVEGVTNINMLQNPYNTQSEPIVEPRVLTRQLINDINNKKLPKYITENKGVGELAYRLLSSMINNGVKLVTIEILRSYISGKKFSTMLDPGGHKVGRAIAYYQQLLSDAKKLLKMGQLNENIKLILDKYTKGLISVLGESVLQTVDYIKIDEAMKQLALMSGVLSRLFNQQNALEPSNLVPFETLMGLEKPIDTLIPNKDPNFFLQGQQENLPNAPQIQDPDITEIPLQAPTAEIPIQAQEGIKHPEVAHESKSNILRNALIAGGVTAAAIGTAYLYSKYINSERDRLMAGRNIADLPIANLVGANAAAPIVAAQAIAGQPPAVKADLNAGRYWDQGGNVAIDVQESNVENAMLNAVVNQASGDLDGGSAQAAALGYELDLGDLDLMDFPKQEERTYEMALEGDDLLDFLEQKYEQPKPFETHSSSSSGPSLSTTSMGSSMSAAAEESVGTVPQPRPKKPRVVKKKKDIQIEKQLMQLDPIDYFRNNYLNPKVANKAPLDMSEITKAIKPQTEENVNKFARDIFNAINEIPEWSTPGYGRKHVLEKMYNGLAGRIGAPLVGNRRGRLIHLTEKIPPSKDRIPGIRYLTPQKIIVEIEAMINKINVKKPIEGELAVQLDAEEEATKDITSRFQNLFEGDGRKRGGKKSHKTKASRKEIKNIDDEIMRILSRR